MAVEERLEADALDVAEEMPAHEIDETFVPIPKDEVAGVEIEGEAVLVIEGKWSVHWLNQISTAVWESFDGVTNVRDLSAELSRTFNADPATVLLDVVAVTQDFGRAGFLVGVAESTDSGPEGAVPPGREIPPFELPDIDGRGPITLESFRGQRILLVNWSPTCGFCKAIAPELTELQTSLRESGVEPVFIAGGGEELNREFVKEFGLDVTMLLQEPNEADVFYGMGTPAAYLIDEEGKAAAEIAFGSDAVPVLARKAAGLPPREPENGQDQAHVGHRHNH